jgi:hypothetical protein
MKVQTNIRRWKHDPRSKRFNFHDVFGSVWQLPQTLGKPRTIPDDQEWTSRCTAYASAADQGLIDGIAYSPDAQAAFIGQMQGKTIDQTGGSDPNTVMKVRCKVGHLPKSDAIYTLAIHGPSMSQDWHLLYEFQYTSAKEHLDAGYVKICAGNGLDTFDSIRQALYRACDTEKKTGACVQAFGYWYPEWNDCTIIPNVYGKSVGGHCYLFTDFCTMGGVEYLVLRNSYGLRIGTGGYQYMTREVANKEFAKAYTTLKMVVPMTPEQIARLKEESVWGKIQRQILDLWWILSERCGV